MADTPGNKRAKPIGACRRTRTGGTPRVPDLRQGPDRYPPGCRRPRRPACARDMSRPRRAGDNAPARTGRRLDWKDQPPRVRVRHDQRRVRIRARPQSHDPTRSPGGSSGGSAGERRRRAWRSPPSAPIRAAPSASPPPPAVSSASSRVMARFPPRVWCRCLERWITSDRSRATRRRRVTGVSRAPGERGPHRLRRGRSAVRLRVPREYLCDLLDDDVRARSKRLSIGCGRQERTSRTSRSGTRATSRRLSPSGACRCGAYHATTLERMPERYTPPVRLRLEMGRYVLAEDYVRALEGRELLRREVDGPLRFTTLLSFRRCRFQPARSAEFSSRSGGHRASSQPHASADPAFQSDRASRDRDPAGRPDRAAVSDSARRLPDADRRAAEGRPGVRGSDQRRAVNLFRRRIGG